VTSDQRDRGVFVQYMLAEFEMSWSYSQHLSEQVNRAIQLATTLISLIAGAAVTIVATVKGVDGWFLAAAAATLVGAIGLWTVRIKGYYDSVEIIETVLRGGIHAYFGRHDPEAFSEFGGRYLVSRHSFPDHRSRATESLWHASVAAAAVFGLGIGALAYRAAVQTPVMPLELTPPWTAGLSIAIGASAFALGFAAVFHWKRRGCRAVERFRQQLVASTGTPTDGETRP